MVQNPGAGDQRTNEDHSDRDSPTQDSFVADVVQFRMGKFMGHDESNGVVVISESAKGDVQVSVHPGVNHLRIAEESIAAGGADFAVNPLEERNKASLRFIRNVSGLRRDCSRSATGEQ